MKVTIQLQDGSSFEGISGSGHRVVMDVAPEMGGQDLGPRPMEMVLLGLGGCTAIDVLHILRAGRQNVTNMEVSLDAERSCNDPKVFTRIRIHFVLTGLDLSQHKVRRAIDLSAKKYCSASMMLNKTADITYDFEILEHSLG